MRYEVWEEDADFVQADPLDGRWDYEIPRINSTPWDDLYRGMLQLVFSST
jgi:hypothetical protein